MDKKIDKIRPETLLQLLRVVLETSSDFRYISGVQPFFMEFADECYHVYVKNVSSAYFEDRGSTTRAQLPIRPEFDEIKRSPYPFIFLGYDADNDVCICWDYHIAKQRLNAANSVSFYSRRFFQEEVKRGEFLRKTLKNGDRPVFFKRKDIVSFFEQIDTFFSHGGQCVVEQHKPVVTKSGDLKQANLAEREDYQSAFENYIIESGLSQRTCTKYSTCLAGRVSDGISRYIEDKTINVFRFNDTEMLKLWKELLFDVPEYSELDETGKSMYSCALAKYIQFHEDGYVLNQLPAEKVIEVSPNCVCNGKLTKISNMDLVAQIHPLVESNKILQAAQIASKYYSGEYDNMKLNDWFNLVRQVNSNSTFTEQPEVKSEVKKTSTKRKASILRVTTSEGVVIEEKVVANTLVKVVEYAGAEKVRKLGIKLNQVNLVTDTKSEMYGRAQKEIDNNLYVATCCNTNAKQRIIEQISNRLGLNLKVEEVPINSE